VKVLVVGPFGNPRCGEAEYSRNLAQALKDIGVGVATWDGYYPSAHAAGYLPTTAAEFDLIHVVWGPANLGHYLPEHFPEGVPLSVFLADVPPHVTCLLWDRADIRISVHGELKLGVWIPEVPGTYLIEHPAPVAAAPLRHQPKDRIRIGVTGIRDDPGHQMVADLCARMSWEFSAPNPTRWLSTQEEISRLESCHVLACWYQERERGISMGVGYCMAAARPIVLSPSRMFNHVRRWPAEFYFGRTFNKYELEDRVEHALDDMEVGRARLPEKSYRQLSWKGTAHHLVALWEQTIRRKKEGGKRG
jgi:hypothetical protein